MIKNKLILGTVQFGLNYGINNSVGKPSTENIKAILNLAFNNGIELLDTAEAYGNSQERIGEYHQNSTHKFQVITKFSSVVKGLSLNIKERVFQNIKTLQIDSLYGYMFHSFSDFENYYPSFEKELISLKKDGVITKIGVSLYSNEEFEKVLEYENISLVQLPFNLLDNEIKRNKILSKAKNKGIEIHTRSAFLQGLFFKQANDLNKNLKPLSSPINKLQNLCSEDYKINDLALNYVYSQKNISKVLIGVDTIEQLKSNLESINKSISKEQLKVINTINIKETDLLNPSNWNL
ncbi:aldo/keto reductase [Tenacibaculum pacificus]|uniref:aldo/keto reductase n=1 Tax=Tenacibaculum pacificus TaxID=3018314 RepID=UPI0022F4047A|nr:aldo/keto reductase [Tenacibaculum pacificus]WBX74535.1 aldo/keto reductase [Tenacibaculum pacificus]